MSQQVLQRKPANAQAETQRTSSGLKVNRPGDTFEQEADRVASAVTSGGHVPSWSIGRVSMGSSANTVQRDGPDPNQQTMPQPNNYGDAAKNAAEAFMKTDAGQKILQAAKDDPLVKGAEDLVSTLPGKIIVGTVATGAVVGIGAGLAEAHKPLPMQIPAIPLDILSPRLKGMSVKVDYEGPVNRPTQGMLTFSYSPGGDTKKKKDDTRARIEADKQALRASMDMFRPKTDMSRPNEEVQQVAAAEKSRFASSAKPAADAPVQAQQQTPIDRKLDLKSADAAPAITNDKDKKEEAPVQRKTNDSAPVLQRKCSCGGSAGADGECEECKAKKQMQRSAMSAGPCSAPSSVEHVLASSGTPLDRDSRSFFESRFGHDFSKVRIHTGAEAASSARDVAAKAYTVENSIVFDGGQYAPHTQEGRKLLAHELTHVVQQTGGSSAAPVAKAPVATAPRAVQRKIVRNKAEMDAKDRVAFLKAHHWINPALAAQIMEEMAAAGDTFDFADDAELQEEIVKRLSTVHHMKESQQSVEKIPGDKRAAFGYPFSNDSLLYGPRVNFAAKDYWQPGTPDNYAVRTDKAKNKHLRELARHERCQVYGDQCGSYSWKLTDKGKADPYHAIAMLFAPQQAHKRTLIHCDYLISLVNFMSMVDALGAAEFNRRVGLFGPEKIVLKSNAFYDLHDTTWLRDASGNFANPARTTKGLKSTQRVRPSTEKDLVIGDHVVFFNHIVYDTINAGVGNAWRLENAVFVSRDHGQDVFLGHGSGYLTEPQMREKLAQEFNFVIDKAKDVTSRTKSRDKKTQTAAQAELTTSFPNVHPVGNEFHAIGTGGLGCTQNIDFKLRRIRPDEVISFHAPCNPAQMNEVERPIESAK